MSLPESPRKIKAPRRELVLSSMRDPYSPWGETQRRRAAWAAEAMSRMGRATHLRGLHYWLVSQAVPRNAEGQPYGNTEQAWDYLAMAVMWAKYQGIGDWKQFRDKKHPEPLGFLDYEPFQPGIEDKQPAPLVIKDLALLAAERVLRGSVPQFSTHGLQAHTLVVFCEKNTMNEVIRPEVSRVDGMFQPLVGEASLERVRKVVELAAGVGKPLRVFYVSDFDPSGKQMPVSVARKMEFFGQQEGLADIKLMPIALTYEQVQQYRLPGVPTKPLDSRAAGFKEVYGDRATELDALEAIHPGELRRIVRAALAPFYSFAVVDRVREENRRITARLEPIIRGALEGIGAAVADLTLELPLLHAETEFVPQRAQEAAGQVVWLLDSKRNEEEQLAEYRRYKAEQ